MRGCGRKGARAPFAFISRARTPRGELGAGKKGRLCVRRERKVQVERAQLWLWFLFSFSLFFSPRAPSRRLWPSCMPRGTPFVFPQGCALTPRTRARRLRYETIYYRVVPSKVDDNDERTSRGTPTGEIAMAAGGRTDGLGFAAVPAEKPRGCGRPRDRIRVDPLRDRGWKCRAFRVKTAKFIIREGNEFVFKVNFPNPGSIESEILSSCKHCIPIRIWRLCF